MYWILLQWNRLQHRVVIPLPVSLLKTSTDEGRRKGEAEYRSGRWGWIGFRCKRSVHVRGSEGVCRVSHKGKTGRDVSGRNKALSLTKNMTRGDVFLFKVVYPFSISFKLLIVNLLVKDGKMTDGVIFSRQYERVHEVCTVECVLVQHWVCQSVWELVVEFNRERPCWRQRQNVTSYGSDR